VRRALLLAPLALVPLVVMLAGSAQARHPAKHPKRCPHQARRGGGHARPRRAGCGKPAAKRVQPAAPAPYSSYADTAPPAASDLSLPPGGFRFWQGPTVPGGYVPSAAQCGISGPCYTWQLPVAKGGWRLRVALDTPMRTNAFELDVVDPAGKLTSVTNSNAFDAEAFVTAPAAGIWTLRVMPQSVMPANASFRMRAKLEAAPPQLPTGHVPLLPELRADPPTEFSFVAPANPANGLYPPDTVNPPLDVLGFHPLSCSVDEMAPTAVQGGGATPRCLRFTSGPINVGQGPYEMHWTYAQDIVGGKIQSPIAHGPLFQTVHYADGTTTTRPAGTYSFHVIHFHFHDDSILDMRLFRVNSDQSLTEVGTGTKSGFCPANQLLGIWRSFANEPPNAIIGSGDIGTGNCQNPADGVLGLSPGWGDVYRWQRPGMYVEFGGNPDGLYVVRITIDTEHRVLQSSYAYNSAYALVRVNGDTIQEIERGQGLSPWDPHKIVFTGAGPASQN
jgi:hypothetical protein